MRLPRDVGGEELARALARVGYRLSRRRGSHIRLTREAPEGTHHITIPARRPLRVGTLSAVLKDVAGRLGLTLEELVARLGL